MKKIATACLLVGLLGGRVFAAEELINAAPEGFKPVFNGKDLRRNSWPTSRSTGVSKATNWSTTATDST